MAAAVLCCPLWSRAAPSFASANDFALDCNCKLYACVLGVQNNLLEMHALFDYVNKGLLGSRRSFAQ